MPPLHVTIGGRRVGSYRACGLAGFAAAVALVIAVSLARADPLAVALLVTTASVAAFLVGVKLTVVAFGHERIVFYEQALGALAASALALRLTGRALGSGLDLATLGVFAFLAGGRLGCYAAGCCHGRPARHGVRYGREHAEAGFALSLVGVPLWPLQLLEAALAAVLTTGGALLLVLLHPRPGSVTAALLGAYGVTRSLIELQRGDVARPVWLGVTEAQWTALAVAWALVWFGRDGALRWWPAHLAAALALSSLVAALALGRPRWAWTRWGLGDAAHVGELARGLRAAERSPGLTVFSTSRGARVSHTRDGATRHIALSRAGDPLRPVEAAALAEWIGRLTGGAAVKLQQGATAGVFHLFLSRGEGRELGPASTEQME